ncbi:MAG: hypothetical protein ABI830_04110, partial [Pseudolabrys sp.]
RALGLALFAAALAGAAPAPARAADEGTSFEGKILDGIMTRLGLRKDGEGINYQERPPLVLPSGKTLPPPERSDAVVANNPAWPKDPDVIKRRVEAEQERIPRTTVDMENAARPLRPNELTPGGDPRKMRKQSAVANRNYNRDDLTAKELGSSGSILGSMFSKKNDDQARFTGEAPRAALTDPPAGYQTPSPDQPYGLGKDMTMPKAFDYKNDRGTQNN